MPDTPEPRPGSQPDALPGARVPEFDEFYLGSRRRLVLEAYALTGDLSAARTAVRDAFVAAWHHWDKVRRLSDAEEWVRPRAWAMAQRRHVARLWRREKGLSGEQKSVLDALHHLPDQQRKILLLAHLAGLSEGAIGRELGESATHVETQVDAAVQAFCARTGVSPDEVTAAIESLAPVAEATALPHPTAVQRGGRRRRQVHAVVGVVTLLALVLLGGTFVVQTSTAPQAAAETAAQRQQESAKPVTADMMLSLAQVRISAPEGPWQLLSTSDNTSGTGINSVCQDTRFADPEGRGTLVRTFVADGTDTQSNYVQTVEISQTPEDAAQAYRTTLGWFAGCRKARLQLLTTYRLRGLGEVGQILKLRIPGTIPRSYVVGLTRTGSLTVSAVMETLKGRPIPIKDALALLTAAVRNVCDADASGACPGAVVAAPVLPPRSGEPRGTLAAADLPVVGQVNRPWVGTRPVPARPNLAATTCDKADFVRSGAPGATSAHVPDPAVEDAPTLRHHRDRRCVPGQGEGCRLRPRDHRRPWPAARSATSARRSAASSCRRRATATRSTPCGGWRARSTRPPPWASGWVSPGWGATLLR